MIKILTRFLRDTSGASAVEYALILAIVGGGISVAALALGTSVSNAMGDTSSCMDDINSC